MTDYQGSTIALIDNNQQVAAKYTYTPYGTTTATGRAAAGDPFRWIGSYQNTDNHGTYNLGYRQYDPKLGRFTQTDPSGQEPNPYTYGLGNPVTNTDPSGLDAGTVSDYSGAGAGYGSSVGVVLGGTLGAIFFGGAGAAVSFGTLTIPGAVAGGVGGAAFGGKLGAAVGAGIGAVIGSFQ